MPNEIQDYSKMSMRELNECLVESSAILGNALHARADIMSRYGNQSEFEARQSTLADAVGHISRITREMRFLMKVEKRLHSEISLREMYRDNAITAYDLRRLSAININELGQAGIDSRFMPNVLDADEDGIVDEGHTVWERLVG